MDSNHPKSLFKNWIINHALALAQLLWPLISFAAGGLWISIGEALSTLDLILISVLFANAIFIITRAVWKSVSYRSYYYPISRIKAQYTVIEKVTSYCIENNELHFFRRMRIKANQHNVNGTTDKFIWTGDKKSGFPTAGEGVQAIRPNNTTIGIWSYFDIFFTAPLSKGSELNFVYNWPVIMDYKSSSPFVSASTEEPTKKLTLVVHLGTEFSGKEVVLEEFRAIEGIIPIKVTTAHLDQAGHYEWTPSRTKRFRYYRIRWSWEINQSAPLVLQAPSPATQAPSPTLQASFME